MNTVITEDQHKEFKELAMPLIKWLKSNLNPHCSIIITNTDAEIVEGIAAVSDEPEIN